MRKTLIAAAAVALATVPASSLDGWLDGWILDDSRVEVGPSHQVPGRGADLERSAEMELPHAAEPEQERSGASPAATARAERIPVLVIPGWSDDEEKLATLRTRLTAAGWDSTSVVTLSFEDAVGSNLEHAHEIAQAVTALKARTGADRIDIVAHSMGGLATRYFLLNGGDAHVRRVVFLATPHRGTISAHFGWGEGAREMQPQSPFLLALLRARPIPPGVRAITIRTPIDLHVVPPESATLPGVPDLKVCCPTHAGLLEDDQTFELIQRFLRDSG